MKRRHAIQTLATAAAALPLLRVPLEAQELSSDQVFVLRDVAATVLPSALGRKGQDEAVDNFLRWLREYNEASDVPPGMGVKFLSLAEGAEKIIEKFLTQRDPLFFES